MVCTKAFIAHNNTHCIIHSVFYSLETVIVLLLRRLYCIRYYRYVCTTAIKINSVAQRISARINIRK